MQYVWLELFDFHRWLGNHFGCVLIYIEGQYGQNSTLQLPKSQHNFFFPFCCLMVDAHRAMSVVLHAIWFAQNNLNFTLVFFGQKSRLKCVLEHFCWIFSINYCLNLCPVLILSFCCSMNFLKTSIEQVFLCWPKLHFGSKSNAPLGINCGWWWPYDAYVSTDSTPSKYGNTNVDEWYVLQMLIGAAFYFQNESVIRCLYYCFKFWRQ